MIVPVTAARLLPWRDKRAAIIWGILGITMFFAAVMFGLYRLAEDVFPSPTGQVPKSEQPSFDYGRRALNGNVQYSKDCVAFIKAYPVPSFKPYSVSAAIKGCKYEFHILTD